MRTKLVVYSIQSPEKAAFNIEEITSVGDTPTNHEPLQKLLAEIAKARSGSDARLMQI